MKTKINGAKVRQANKGLVRGVPAIDPRLIKRRLEEGVAELRASGVVPRATLELIEQLAGIGAHRVTDLGEFEVINGMTVAAALTALACSTSPEQFLAWLRSMAA